MELYISPFNLTTTFLEFEQYLMDNNLSYLLLEISSYNQDIFTNLSSSENYTLLFSNLRYYVYFINSYSAIGSANTQWKSLPFWGSNHQTISTGTTVPSLGCDDAQDKTLWFLIDIPLLLGSKKLTIANVLTALRDADADDYVTEVALVGMSDQSTRVEIDDDPTDLKTIDEHKWNVNPDQDISSYQSAWIRLDTVCTDVNQLEIAYVLIQYYYA